MFKPNKNAAAIMALPAARHPRLVETARVLADADVSTETAARVLDGRANDLGVTKLDIETVQPGENVQVPFAVTEAMDERTDYDRGVADIVQAKLARLTK